MLEKYGLTPSCYDAFLENKLFANRTLSLTEQVNQMKRDLRCAKLLGFPVIRIGSRTLFPREGFVRFCRAQHLEETARWR